MWWLKYYKQNEANGEADGGAGGSPSDSSGSSADSAGEPVNWAGLDEDFDVEEVSVEGDSEVVETTKAEAPVKADEQAAPAATPPATPPVVPPAPPAAEIPPQPAAQPTPAQPGQPPADYQAWRQTRETELASTLYVINDADAQALLTEPETVLPRMAARMHMEVMESTMRALQSVLPQAIQGYTQHEQANTQAKQFFSGVNPDLANPAYEPYILQFGEVYRKVNPSAGPEEAARAIGSLVRSALGIAAPQQGVTPPPAMQVSQQPAPVPFTPARGSGTGSAAPAPANPFAQLANEFLNDDM